MAKAWVYQDAHQVDKVGIDQASWYVGWIDPEGKRRCKSCGAGAKGKRAAKKLRQKREAELIEGTYQSNARKTWTEFRQAYEAKIAKGMDTRNREETLHALGQFERIIKPKMMKAIKTQTVDEFIAERRTEAGIKPGSKISPATVNKELRHLRAVFRKATKWKFLAETPDIAFLKEPGKLPTYIPPEDFAKIYGACEHARLPADQPYLAADWWRGMLMSAYMTGWRIGSLLALRREDVNLETGLAKSRAEDTKGKRDQLVVLHPVVLEHLRKVPSFDSVFFPWNNARRMLYEQFARIQEKAGVKAAGKDRYGFHDLRRAFATMNAERLTPDALQALMQHKDYKTTQRYIAIARQLTPAVGNLFVPDVTNPSSKAN